MDLVKLRSRDNNCCRKTGTRQLVSDMLEMLAVISAICWQRAGDALAMCWRYVGDALVMFYRRVGDLLMVKC